MPYYRNRVRIILLDVFEKRVYTSDDIRRLLREAAEKPFPCLKFELLDYEEMGSDPPHPQETK